MISLTPVPAGLGNQMFQYAAGFSLAKAMCTTLFFPEKPKGPDLRSPNLYHVFNLSSIRTGVHGPLYDASKLGFHYTPLPKDSNITLHGYFQSYKYFIEYEEDLKKEFTFLNPIKYALPKNSVSLHVRRGDYLKHPTHHPLCSAEYYSKAMNEFKGCNFVVFSDDIMWCKQYFKEKNVYFSPGKNNFEDLELISKCENHIIANSSFSWWGSWLCTNYNKKVIAPKNWFGPAYSFWSTEDLYIPEWKLI
jgi:hypothetical protein